MKKKLTPKAKTDSSKNEASITEKKNLIPVTVHKLSVPSLDMLLDMAQEEPDQREFEEYVQVIGILRDKSFSYREIAEWFCERSIEVDHNTVYRVYMMNLSDNEIQDELQQQEEEAREEFDRSR